MKNKIKILFYFLIILFFSLSYVKAEKFEYTSDKIKILEEGNIITGDGGINIKIGDNIFISARQFVYNRNSGLLEITNNVKFNDNANKIQTTSSKIIFYEKLDIIEIIDNIKFKDNTNKIEASSSKIIFFKESGLFEIIDNVKFNDNANKIEASSSKIFFSKTLNKVYSNTKTNIIYNNDYNINLDDFEYDINNKKISSKNLTSVEDSLKNYFEINGFILNTKINKFLGKEIKFIDLEKNEYFLKDVMINTKNKNIYGRDLDINFNNLIFGNEDNDPRLSAKSIKIKNKSSFLKKGVFTTCSSDNECPPWSLYAEEIEHDKKEQVIKYKNAWLKIYDVPAVYFPRFSHPDPTVNRKSGFLSPKFSNSKSLGTSVNVPYFHVISENKDLTFKPKIFFDDEIVLQNEYRQVNKKSNHIIDFSLATSNFLSSKNSTKMHFYSNSKFETDYDFFDSSDIELNLQKVNNDDYLRTYNIEHDKLIYDTNLLHSYIDFKGYKNDVEFSTSLEVYEDLTKDKTSRHEFIYPKYKLQKRITSNNGNNIFLKSYGSQRIYETNLYEGIVINDLMYSSQSNYSNKGLVTNYNALLKNVNVDAKNSNKYKEKFEQSVSTIFQYNTKYPLKKESSAYLNNFTPKVSFMYSPNKTKNLSTDNRRIDSTKIFSFNRIANNETVEGGGSLTYGASYNKIKKNTNEDLFNFDISSLIRLEENLDLPKSSTLGKKTSDIFGNFEIYPNDIFSLKYNFALDNNFDKSNYDSIASTFSVNRFVTTFEYSDEKNNLINESFTSNSTYFEFDKNNSINFNVRRNNEISATEYYNLIYNYKNDCLVASVKFNKEFYKDADLEPEKAIFFTLSLIPFGGVSNLN